MMLDKIKSSKTALWKYGFSAPLFVLMLIFSAAAATSENSVINVNSKQTVLDAVPVELLKSPNNGVDATEVHAKVPGAGESENKPVQKPAEESNVPASSEVESPEHPALPDTLVKSGQLEVTPEFEGGMKAFGQYLGANIKYPAEAKAKNIQGRVVLGFTVKKDGSLDDVTVVKSVESSLDAEAVRVLKGSPKWKPGIMNGRPVNVAYTMPVVFNLPPKPEAEKTN